jgi:hypothetical protein
MNPFDRTWQKLTALARQAPAAALESAPLGLATRVVARAWSQPAPRPWAVMERLAWRGLMVAVALGGAAAIFDDNGSTAEPIEDYATAVTVNELLDLT